MNEVERMRIELDAALKRVRKLEIIFESQMILNDDEREAQRMAELLGFPVSILMVPVRNGIAAPRAHRTVARELRTKKRWPVSRIARALHVCEDTARGWVSKRN